MSIDSYLTELINPYSLEDFWSNYYEREYLYISRDDSTYYDAILNADDLNSFWQNRRLPYDRLEIKKAGAANVSFSEWTNIKLENKKVQYIVDNDKVFDFFNRGYTIIITTCELSMIKLTNFCSALQRELEINVEFNIYISPPNSQGLATHYDDHDVFILPIKGNKIWHLYHVTVELPCGKYYRRNRDLSGQKVKLKPEVEIELKAGDLLYIPRGILHDARTTDSTSIHITVGLHPYYYFDILQELVNLAEENPEFRRALPNRLTSEREKSLFKDKFRQLTQTLIDNLDLEELLERKFDQFLERKPLAQPNRFQDLLQLNRLNLNSLLSKRENLIFKVERDSKNIYLKFAGTTISYPLFVEKSLKIVFQDQPFAVKDIGGLIGDRGRIDLACELIREGFLTIDKI